MDKIEVADKKLKINHYSREEIKKIIDGYRALNDAGRMQDFFLKVKACRFCESLSIEKRPINRVLNSLDLNSDVEKEAMDIQERYKTFKNEFGREFNEPIGSFDRFEGKDQEFYDHIMSHWPDNVGFSIGICGWTDASMLESKPKPEIMLIGADWYPLRSQSTFLIEREDQALLKPYKFLSKLFPEMDKENRLEIWKGMFENPGIYFTNAMLCYRPQSNKVGNQNIAPESFLYCQNHLEAQIRIIKPKLIITWGLQPALSMLRYISKQSPGDETVIKLKELISSGFKFRRLGDFKDKSPFKIKSDWGEFHFHPLCHPSMPNRWGKQPDGSFLDYKNLKKWLGEHQWI